MKKNQYHHEHTKLMALIFFSKILNVFRAFHVCCWDRQLPVLTIKFEHDSGHKQKSGVSYISWNPLLQWEAIEIQNIEILFYLKDMDWSIFASAKYRSQRAALKIISIGVWHHNNHETTKNKS